MFINQLTVFIENRTGRLDDVLEALKEAGINIISLSLADSSEYGLLRMIVSEPEKAKSALRLGGRQEPNGARATECNAVRDRAVAVARHKDRIVGGEGGVQGGK